MYRCWVSVKRSEGLAGELSDNVDLDIALHSAKRFDASRSRTDVRGSYLP